MDHFLRMELWGGQKGFKGTLYVGITFNESLGLELEIYCYADCGGGRDKKSIGTYIGGRGERAKKLATVASSRTEAEYLALL